MDTQVLLDKETDIGQIWLASHWLTKMTKQQILKQDLAMAVDMIRDVGEVTLKKLGFLVIGVVRILQRKTQYIYYDLVSFLDSFTRQERTRKAKEVNQPRATLGLSLIHI